MGAKAKYYATPNETIKVDIYIDVSKDFPRVLSDEEEAKLPQNDTLPENVVKETSSWAIPTYGIHQWIDTQSFVRKSADPQAGQEFSVAHYQSARIRALLVDWSLDGGGKPAFTRVPAGDMKDLVIQILSQESILKVAQCNPAIVSRFYVKAMSKLYPTEEDRKNSG